MMVKLSATIFIFYATSSWSAIENHPASWLDRLVFHYKKEFLAEVSKLPAVPFQATIEKAPSGYVDSTAWDFDSVMRLLTLIQTSDNLPLRRSIHEALKPTRRLFIAPGRNKFKIFPSLAKDHVDNFYYDGVDSAEYWASDEVNVFNASDTSAIILVTNPVESRLPSARISVDLLRDIMMTRALAAREMPATITKQSTAGSAGHGTDSTTAASPNDSSPPTDPNASPTVADPNASPTTVADPNASTTVADPNASPPVPDPSASTTVPSVLDKEAAANMTAGNNTKKS